MVRLLVAQGRGKSKVQSRGQLSWREGILGRSLLTVGMGNRGRQGPDGTLHGSSCHPAAGCTTHSSFWAIRSWEAASATSRQPSSSRWFPERLR